MAHKYYTPSDDFTAVSLRNYDKENLEPRSFFFIFLVFNTFVILLSLITILYPIKLCHNFICGFLSIQLHIKNIKIKIYHILCTIIIGFYIYLYFALKTKVQGFIPNKNETYSQRMARLDKIWVVESEIWMVFIIIISLISIYRNAYLFNEEIQLEEKIKKIDLEIRKKNENNNEKNAN